MSVEKAPSEGVLYIAFGSFYLLLALHSAYTLKMKNSEISVCLFTNQRVSEVLVDGVLVFDKIIFHDAPDSENRHYKLSMDIYTPFEKTLFLDTDTEVHGDLSPIFTFLDTVSLCVKSNCYPARKSQEILINSGSIQKLGLSEFNSGVIGFRIPHVHDFFQDGVLSIMTA